MNAKLVWQTWRKILRDESLQQRVFDPTWQPTADAGLTPAEQAVVAAYADNRERAKWFIENYQFRLVNSFINALETGAPLTLRALLNSGQPIEELSRCFLRAHDWHDYGPRVYHYAYQALSWLCENQQHLQLSAALVDLMGLEKETTSLYLFLQTRAAKPAIAAPYGQSGMARLYRSRYQLSGWLRDKKSLGVSEPLIGAENLLVVLPNFDSRHKYLRLTKRCAELFLHPEKAYISAHEQDELDLARLVAANALITGSLHEVR